MEDRLLLYQIIIRILRYFQDTASLTTDEKKELLNEYAIANIIDELLLADKIVIINDRGACDVRAYLGEDNYQKLLKENNYKHDDLLKRYDLVIHMVTVAREEEGKYTNSNNKARFEDIEGAIGIDDNIADTWKDHHNLKVAPVCDLLEEKIDIVLNYVDDLLDINEII